MKPFWIAKSRRHRGGLIGSSATSLFVVRLRTKFTDGGAAKATRMKKRSVSGSPYCALSTMLQSCDAMEFATAASLGCRFVTSFRAIVDQGRVTPGEWVAVHGCGGVGLSAIMIASAMGANVIAVDLTKSQFGIPVVRIVIPYLEGVNTSSKYAPGPRARPRPVAE